MSSTKTIWIDFENAPHVWVLKEFITEFKKHELRVVITARDFSSTVGLCNLLGIKANIIGKNHHGKNKWLKSFRILERAILLYNFLKKDKIKPQIAISHGSRSQSLAAFLIRCITISLDDYEKSFKGFNLFIDFLLCPEQIPKTEWGIFSKKVIHYPGLKEELYLWNKENYSTNEYLPIEKSKINILFRPESPFSHYSNPMSKFLQDELIELFIKNKSKIHIILIARDKNQEKEISKLLRENNLSFIIPEKTLPGPALIYHCDYVFSGGGTMTREACVLKTPSYSFFGGVQGNVDKFLETKKWLVVLKSTKDISEISFNKKNIKDLVINNRAFSFVLDFINGKFI